MSKQQWQDSQLEILQKLDLKSEYASMGIRFTKKNTPNNKGWLPCFGMRDDDDNPSAAINIAGNAELLGRYKDHGGGGESLSFWDFCVKYRSDCSTFIDPIKIFAEKTSVELPKSKFKRDHENIDHLPDSPATWRMFSQYASSHAGITREGMVRAGCTLASYPASLQVEHQQILISVPVYGPNGLDAGPQTFTLLPPVGKIRLYKGKDQEPQLLTKMNMKDGGSGMFLPLNFATAEIILKVEGVSDYLAALSLDLPAGVVAVSNMSGSSGDHSNTELVKSVFAGKVVYVVHDQDDAGQNGADAWAIAIAKHAKECRKLTLPYPKVEKKGKDLRDFIQEGHTWSDIQELATGAEVVSASEKEIKQYELVLKTLGITVIGENESGVITCFSEILKKLVEFKDISRIRYPLLLQSFGERVRELVVEGDQVPQPGQYQLKDVVNAIALSSSSLRFSPDQMVGQGVWQNGDAKKLLLVNADESAVWNGENLERNHSPRIGHWVIDSRAAKDNWYRHDELSEYLQKALDVDWRIEQFAISEEMFGRWKWAIVDGGRIITSMIIASWSQSIWTYRPQIFILGQSNSGKSTLFEKLVAVFGALCEKSSKPTEASLRQGIGITAKIPICDEMEKSKDREKIFEDLVRPSTRGDVRTKGTPWGKVIRFNARHIFWMGAIESGLHRQADANRFLVLEALASKERTLDNLYDDETCRRLGQKLLAVSCVISREAKIYAERLKAEKYPNIDQRIIEAFAVPAGIVGAVHAWDYETTKQQLSDFLILRIGESDPVRDHDDLVDDILGATFQTNSIEHRNVSVAEALFDSKLFDVHEDLERHGIRQLGASSDNPAYIAIHPKTVQRKLLRGTPWERAKIEEYLARIDGAEKSRPYIGKKRVRAITIPIVREPDELGQISGPKSDPPNNLGGSGDSKLF